MYYNLEHFKLFLFVFFSVHSFIITPSHSVTLFRFRSLSYLLLLSLYTKCVSTTIVGTPRATHPLACSPSAPFLQPLLRQAGQANKAMCGSQSDRKANALKQ